MMIEIFGYDIGKCNRRIKKVRHRKKCLTQEEFEKYKEEIEKRVIEYNEEGEVITKPWFIYRKKYDTKNSET